MKWAYIRETWEFDSTIEIEEKHTGRYGAKGQVREKKEKPLRRKSQSKISGDGKGMSGG